MFRFKGTIIRPNMKTQYWYIQRMHTLAHIIVCANQAKYENTVLVHSEDEHTGTHYSVC